MIEIKERIKKHTLTLFDNVQFIYELALAQLELESFGVNFEITNGLREFGVIGDVELQVLKRRLAYFKSIDGIYTDYYKITSKNRTKSVNQYLTHWIYPYKGKFHPQMIRALLNIIGVVSGETVLDPFIGSGTTALEAQLLGVNCIGFDISPLCVLQSKVKTESIQSLNAIIALKDEIELSFFFNADENKLDKFIASIEDEVIRNFYLMAKLVAISDNARRKREFQNSFLKNLKRMILSLRDYSDVVEQLGLKLGNVDIRVGDARNLPLPDGSVDGIITSPPYSVALDYVKNDEHALKALGYDVESLREEFIGVRGKGKDRLDLYNEDMRKSIDEMYRVLKSGRYAVIIIGNATYQGKEIKTTEFIIDRAEEAGFTLVKNIDKIIFGLYNVMQKENILIFKKDEKRRR
ncbi:MAG: DNA methyltransferase [Candidatus Kryptonium sp.]|nr:DNA methyltransferase [Candidatus Kryptonium sp.]MDW8109415.1 DNA methyltransferase [Candidatus Kryptonium sp.]